MESVPPSIPEPPAAVEPGLSPWERAIAVYARPTQAWSGLRERSQWWFPLVLLLALNAAFAWVLHDRAIVPMVTARWEQMVDSGQMTTEQLDRARASFETTPMRVLMVAQQAVVWPIFMALVALVLSFVVSFMIGTKMPYGQAFAVANWASLVQIPGLVLTGVLAWIHETMQGVHLGLAVLLPEGDHPGRLVRGLATFLDALGPFSIWWVVVLVLGAATVAQAPRRNVAQVVGGTYVVLALLVAVLAAIFTPG